MNLNPNPDPSFDPTTKRFRSEVVASILDRCPKEWRRSLLLAKDSSSSRINWEGLTTLVLNVLKHDSLTHFEKLILVEEAFDAFLLGDKQ